jgi:hypothetical protein
MEMHMFLRSLALVALATACNGTGSGDTDASDSLIEITGFYEIRRHTKSLGSCEGGNDVEIPVPMIRIDEPSAGTLEIYFCRSQEDCNDFPEVDWTVSADGNDWYGSSYASYVSEQEMQCALFFDEVLLEARTDGSVVVERAQKTAFADTIDDGECTELGETWEGVGGACIDLEVLRGDKVQ